MTFVRRYKTVEDVLENTKRNGACMEWQGGLNKEGYGACCVYGLFKSQLLHREVFALVYGSRPSVVMHACDNPRCINPKHLFAGSPEANLIDKLLKGKQARGEQNGNSKLTEAEVKRIRHMHRNGTGTYLEIGMTFGVSRSTVWRVVTETHWKANGNHR